MQMMVVPAVKSRIARSNIPRYHQKTDFSGGQAFACPPWFLNPRLVFFGISITDDFP